MNWFFVTFIAEDGEEDAGKGAGLSTHVKVEDVDDYYKEVVSKGLSPDGEPQARHGGGREFVLRDPDGYKLVFFEKK